MKTILKMICVAVTVTLLTIGAKASNDPFAGKWILDVHHSKYPAGTCPKRLVIEMEAADQGIRYRSETTYTNGAITHAEYSADYNGKQVIVTGGHGMLLPVTLKRINSHNVVASYTQGLQIVATSRRVVSRDGRLMTITTTSKDSSGHIVTTVGTYRKD
jgi:hypothetical protein